ncbi:hypothetical protein GCM10023185_02020 [Hymenobacter saemangeumensis]|uniref:DUF6799 domain-containing protein n=1 Tax=Hymenobacter saemangeumensis TaxID=1084522 RepID=A0ABP8HY10_9BACT
MKNALKFLPALALFCFAGTAHAQTAPAKAGTAQTTPDTGGYIYMNKGKMIQVEANGSMIPMANEVTLADGSKVRKDGTVISKSGKTSTLKDQQQIGMDGKMR